MTLTTTKTPTHRELSAVQKKLQQQWDHTFEYWKREYVGNAEDARNATIREHGERPEAAEIPDRDDLIAIYDDNYETLTITDGEFSHQIFVGDYLVKWDNENDCPRPRPAQYGLKESKDFVDEFERIRGKKLHRKVAATIAARQATFVAPKMVKFTVTITVEERMVQECKKAFRNIGGVHIETEEV